MVLGPERCMNYNQRDVDPQGGGAPTESVRDGGLRSDKLRGAIGLLRKPLDAQGVRSLDRGDHGNGKEIDKRRAGKSWIAGDKCGIHEESELGSNSGDQ